MQCAQIGPNQSDDLVQFLALLGNSCLPCRCGRVFELPSAAELLAFEPSNDERYHRETWLSNLAAKAASLGNTNINATSTTVLPAYSVK